MNEPCGPLFSLQSPQLHAPPSSSFSSLFDRWKTNKIREVNIGGTFPCRGQKVPKGAANEKKKGFIKVQISLRQK